MRSGPSRAFKTEDGPARAVDLPRLEGTSWRNAAFAEGVLVRAGQSPRTQSSRGRGYPSPPLTPPGIPARYHGGFLYL